MIDKEKMYMILKEEKRDLFTVGDSYYLVHCISSDLGMGAGIVVEFNKRFDMKRKMQELYPNGVIDNAGWCNIAVRVGNVFNLITKKNYWNKPTLNTLEQSLDDMKRQLLEYITANKEIKLAMPLIGCGLDKLKWADVRKVIERVFGDMNIEILVCYL